MSKVYFDDWKDEVITYGGAGNTFFFELLGNTQSVSCSHTGKQAGH